MKLDLDRMPAGQSTLCVDDACDLDMDQGGLQRVRIVGDLRVDNLEGYCIVRGALRARGPVPCDRCQKEFVLVFPVDVQLMILRQAGGHDESEDADTPVLHQRDGIVELYDCLREAAVLAAPISRRCGKDCRGLCIRCGIDLNEAVCSCCDEESDPRWGGLPG